MKSVLSRMAIVLLSIIGVVNICSAEPNENISKVYVLFKTHLDVGFTDLSSVVEQRYINEFIPKAIDVAEKLRKDQSGDRYIWTTGSWLIWKYLHSASPDAVKRLEKAIENGDIVWNGVPYTVETETMNSDLLMTNLLISKILDKRYGKNTIAAKMTDVPGHTRSIIKSLSLNGIRFLHIGVNPASPIPDVPAISRWRDPENNEIILMYQKDYGSEEIFPDGKTAISVNFTGDNHGPHNYEAVKKIYSDLRQRYPNAEIAAVSFNEVASELLKYKDSLPVVTSEIGDTWIHGYGSAPIRMAKFRALQRLYSQWLKDGKLNRDEDVSVSFAVELGLIAEHTQGMDIKTHLRNWDKYDMDKFLAARSTEPFRKVEKSWKEIDDYLYSAIEYLPADLQKEATDTLTAIDNIEIPAVPSAIVSTSPADGAAWQCALLKDGMLKIDGLFYQMFDSRDYTNFLNNYLRAHYGWALDDFGKTGLDKSGAVSATLEARAITLNSVADEAGTRYVEELYFPRHEGVDGRVYPRKMIVTTFEHRDGNKAEIELTLIDKPAVRLPEAYWLSFSAADILSLVAEKTGQPVDLLDVVERGNRHMHGIDRYVDIITTGGTVRITSPDAFLINVGEHNGLNYSTAYPDKNGGIHFNLSNNLWDTNFAMWNEGSITYRFTVELI